jgi:hypothetical protein
LTVPDEKVATLLKEVKEQSERTKKPVSDEAFREMVKRVIAS